MPDPHSICRCGHERQEHNEGGCGVLVGSWSDGVCPCREFAAREASQVECVGCHHVVTLPPVPDKPGFVSIEPLTGWTAPPPLCPSCSRTKPVPCTPSESSDG